MKTKKEIIENWLPRYTGLPLEKFGKYILLTNFQNYVDRFAKWQGVDVVGRDRSMPCATDGEITIINFSMGSANAATIMDLLGAIQPTTDGQTLVKLLCWKPLVTQLYPTLCDPWTAARQAPLSIAFSRQDYWSG